MKTLHFPDPVEVEINSSATACLLDDSNFRWSDMIGKVVDLCRCHRDAHDQHTVIGRGQIVEIWCGKFKDAPAMFVEADACPLNRTFALLLCSMRKRYSEAFDIGLPVVYIKFLRIA